MRTRGGCRLEQVKSKCFEATNVGVLAHCSSLEDVIWSYVGWWAKWGWVNWGQSDPEMGGLSWEAEEWNGRLLLILTLRLWVKQRDSPPGTGIKWILCSCPSIGKHSAQTGDLTPLPPGCLPERRMVFPWTEISNTHCNSTLHTGVRGHYVTEMFYYLF